MLRSGWMGGHDWMRFHRYRTQAPYTTVKLTTNDPFFLGPERPTHRGQHPCARLAQCSAPVCLTGGAESNARKFTASLATLASIPRREPPGKRASHLDGGGADRRHDGGRDHGRIAVGLD